MNHSISYISSDSSSESNISDDIIYEDEQKVVPIIDLISWNSLEGNLTNFSEAFKQFTVDDKVFLLKSRCLLNNCTCNFKNHDLLLARVFVDLKILVGKWCKLRFSKGAVPDTDKIATLMFFKDFQGWYELMNENLEVIPFWNNVSQIVQNKPKLFLLRRDSKCLYVKDSTQDFDNPVQFENTTLKAGSVMSFIQCRKYIMKKGKRVKEQYLTKCKDIRENNFFFIPEDTIYASNVAGFDNISGAHTFQSIIEKFHFPINVKPIFMNPPISNLQCSDRHFLQLSERFQLDLIFVTPINDSSRLFLLTPNLFDDHVFTIGEFLPPSVTKHDLPANIVHHMATHRTKIDDFFKQCHKYENLSYLLKHADNISKASQKFEPTPDTEFDDIYMEVEDIYFYIRNGYYPRNPAKEKPKIEDFPQPIAEIVSVSEDSSDISSNEDEDDDDDSTEISTTSTESDKTSSTALELSKKHRVKQAKSMPLSKSKNKIENSQFNTSNSRGQLNLTIDDMVNLSMTGTCVPDDGSINKKVTTVPRFYKNQAIVMQKFKESDIEVTSLKDTVV